MESVALSTGLSIPAVNKNNVKFDHLLFRVYQGAGATPLTIADLELIKVRVTLNGDRYKNLDIIDTTLGELCSLTNLNEGIGQQSFGVATSIAVADMIVGYYDLTTSRDEITIKIDCGAITAANTSPVIDISYYRSVKNVTGPHYQYLSKLINTGAMPTENNVLVMFSVNQTALASTDRFRLTYSNGATDTFYEKIAYALTCAAARIESLTPAFGLSSLFQDDDFSGTSISLETLDNNKRILYVKAL
jgi:hypothetical protein